MDKTTILLPKALRKSAAKRAAALGISLGELIRRKLHDEVASQQTKGKATDPIFDHFEKLVRKGGVKDASLNHDSYLYDNDSK